DALNFRGGCGVPAWDRDIHVETRVPVVKLQRRADDGLVLIVIDPELARSVSVENLRTKTSAMEAAPQAVTIWSVLVHVVGRRESEKSMRRNSVRVHVPWSR